MKNTNQERLTLSQRLYHRNHTWKLTSNGLYLPHSYEHKTPDDLSWWDDVGFIYGGRRIIVWFQHPRMIYSDEIDERAFLEAQEPLEDDWLIKDSVKNYKKVGASRKKIESYTCQPLSANRLAFYDRLKVIRNRLTLYGIDFKVKPSLKIERLDWAIGISLIVPMNAMNHNDMSKIADVAKRLLTRQSTIDNEFPEYEYQRSDWVRENIKG